MSDFDFGDEEEINPPVPTPASAEGSAAAGKTAAFEERLAPLRAELPADSAIRQLSDAIDGLLIFRLSAAELDGLNDLEYASILARKHLTDALDNKEPEVVVAAAKKLYLKRLSEQLAFNKYLLSIHSVSAAKASRANRINSDPLLAKTEIQSVNISTKLADATGKVPSAPELRVRTDMATQRAKEFAPRADMSWDPANLKFLDEASLREQYAILDQMSESLEVPEGWELESTGLVASLDKLKQDHGFSRSTYAALYKAKALAFTRNYISIIPKGGKDSHLSIAVEADPSTRKIIATPEEISITAKTFDHFKGIFDLSNMTNVVPNSETKRANPTGKIKIFLGTHTQNTSDHGKHTKRTKPFGSTAPYGGVFLNLPAIREMDTPWDQYMYGENGPLANWSAFRVQSAAEKLEYTTTHELGHQIQFMISTPAEMVDQRDDSAAARKRAIPTGPEELTTTYAMSKGVEHFAESMTLFVLRQKISPYYRQKLVSAGILLK